MFLVQHNEPVPARRDLFVLMVDAADRVTPKLGLSLSVQIVKAGAAQYAPAAASVAEIGLGTYRVRLAVSDVDTLGSAMLAVTAAGAAPLYLPFQVVRFPDEVHLAKAALANARSHVVATGVDQIKDDDGATVLRTLTPAETDGVVAISAT